MVIHKKNKKKRHNKVGSNKNIDRADGEKALEMCYEIEYVLNMLVLFHKPAICSSTALEHEAVWCWMY